MFREKDELVVMEGEPVWWDTDKAKETEYHPETYSIGRPIWWVLAVVVLALYTLVVARISFTVAEHHFEAWRVEYAEGFMQHMATVEENMPDVVEKVAEDRASKEMMDEFWRTRTWG